MRGRRVRARIAAVAIAGALAVASGCGGSGDGSAAPTSTAAADAGSATAAGSAPPSTASSGTELEAPADEVRPVVIAHRGASGYAPEHTFAAYDLALEQGADFIEQDLQMTADGVLVVLHDDVLDRVARGPAESCSGPVTEKTLAQIKTCDIGSWFNDAYPDRADPAFVGLTVPTMEEVLDRYGDDVRYYVEIKSPEDTPGMETALLEVLDRAGIGGGPGPGSVLIQSFSADSLKVVHGLRPDLPLVQLLTTSELAIDSRRLDDIAGYATGVGPAKALVDDRLIAEAHARCLVVHPYTVDDPAEMAGLIGIGVDGMFTNTPDQLVAVVATAEPAASSMPASCAPGS